jgi:hypothetical protein
LSEVPAQQTERIVVHRPGGRGRRVVRLLVLLGLIVALLLIALVVIVQVVLWSDMPRSAIERELQAQTGLRIEAGALSARWAGVSELRNVTIALPLEDEPLARVSVLRVRHTPLLGLPFRMRVREVVLEEPLVRLRQDDLGRWNIARALEIIQARQPAETPGRDLPPLPRFEVRSGIVNLLDPDGDPLEVPVRFKGEPDGPISWRFALALGEALTAEGRVAPNGEWQHQIDAVVGESQELFAALLPEQALPLRGRAQWRGRLDNGQLTGRASIRNLRTGGFAARGEADVGAADGRVTVRPRGIEVRHHDDAEVIARVLSGSLVFEGPGATVQRLRLEGYGTVLELHGRWDVEQESGQLTASWSGAGVGPVVSHDGELVARILLPEVGASSVKADIRTSGHVEQGFWEAMLNLNIRGGSWQQMIGELTAQRLVWRDEEGIIDASGASARVETSWPIVRLRRAVLPGAERSRVEAWADVPAMNWWLEAEADQWDIPRLRGGALDLRLRAQGDGTRVRIPELRVAGQQFDARASANYDLHRPDPLVATARVVYRTPVEDVGGTETIAEVGSWLAQAEVRGKLQPLDLRMDGELIGRDVRIGDAPVEHVILSFTGYGTRDGAQFTSGEFDLLGGSWRLEGGYVDAERSVALQVTGDAVPLQSVADMLDVPMFLPGLTEGTVQVMVPGLDLDALEIRGQFGVAGTAGG